MTDIDEIVTPAAAIRARWAVTGVFFINGLILASYIVRIPSLKLNHHLTDSQLGVVLTLFGMAALVTMQFVGGFVARFGSARIIRITLVILPVLLVALGFARDVVQLVIAVSLMGTVHGTLDVAMNAHAVVVERIRKRPIMNGCHAAWSISAVIASLAGAAALRSHVSPAEHFLWVGGILVIAGIPVAARLLPASADRDEASPDTTLPARAGWRSGWTGPVLILGAMGLVLMTCEAAVISWSGIFLHENRGATLAAASLGFTAFTGFQTAGRVFGDRLTRILGSSTLFRCCGSIAVIGFAVVVVVPSPTVAIAGFAILGIGMSVLMPLIFSAVGHAGSDGPGAATTMSRFTTFTYGGVLLGPALVGWFAEAFTLTWTFAGLIPLMIGVVLNGRVMAAAGHAPDELAAGRDAQSGLP
jgi:MFS family permease